MILVLGNFAGVFSNLCKLLQWSLRLKKEDTILFYYTNKYHANDNVRVLPYESYEKDLSRILFYSIFEYPQGCSLDTFRQAHSFEMGYPQIPKEALPSCLQPYESGFIFCSPTVYKDPNFSEIRKVYASHIQTRLPFSSHMKEFLESELQCIHQVQSEGKRVLAVFLRSTCHFEGYNLQHVFDELEQIGSQYDYILPITQIRPFFEEVVQRFGEKCIRLSRNYIAQDADWTSQVVGDDEFAKEVRNVVADVYLASQCDFVLGGSSNMFLGALFFNPEVPFKLFEELKTKNGL